MSKQKVWFITGASRGFGFDIAKKALAAGDIVVATVRSKPEQLESKLQHSSSLLVVATVRSKPEQLESKLQHSSSLLVVVLDVINETQVQAGVKSAIDKFGRIDVLVNNAGYGVLGATEEITDAEVRQQYDTNVFGLLNVTRAVLPYLRGQKSGHIINISSVFGYSGAVPGFGLYGSTKYAVEGISEALALEVKPFNIHVTAAAPGLFRTEFASTDSYIASKNVLNAYDASVGQMRLAVTQLNGNQPGNPAKLADVILQIANTDNPPLHLPIGKDAVSAFKTNSIKTGKEIAAWEAVSSSTDYVTA